MRKKISNLILVLLLAAGILIFCYPLISNLWNQFQQNQVAEGYAEVIGSYSREELASMRREARLYNQDLLKDEIIVDPFDQVKDRKANVAYYSTLDPEGNGVMGTVRIPKIHVDLPIYHGTGEDVLQKAVGHLEQTSLPVGGEGTHAVLSAHRGLPRAELFTRLNRLEEGDVFYLDVLGETLAYQVDQVKTVEPYQLEDLAIISGEDHATLVTCTPYAINSHRLLVRGTRIPYQEELDTGSREKETFVSRRFPVFAAAAAAAGILIWRMVRRKKKRGYRKDETQEKE